MKKLLPSILLTHMLFYSACAQKQPSNIYIQSNNTIEKRPTVHYEEPTPVATEYNTVPTPTTEYNDVPTPTVVHNSPSPVQPTPSTNGTTHQLPTIQGKSITIIENGNIGFGFPQYQGKIIIFEIFGKDCEYCKEETPIINRIKREFASSVQVIGIQAQGRMSPSAASSMLRRDHINNPVIEGDDAKELLRFLADTYSWTGVLPYILLVKNNATEYSFPDGGVSYEELKESIKSIL